MMQSTAGPWGPAFGGERSDQLSTVRLTVGQAIVRFLAQQYIERDGEQNRFIAGVWGIFGHGNVAGLGQALEELGDEFEMPYYRPQNEQAQVHLAAAYAKHKNRMQTFACISSIGPGATNMITGAATATVNRLPVLLFPSDYFANRLVDPVLQQVEHPVEHDVSASDAFRPVSRYFDRISRPEQLISSLPEAFRVLTDPAETGAVTISLPEDVQAEVYDWPERFFERRVWRVRRPRPEAELVDEVVGLIRSARRPLIVVGGGAIYAGAEAALDDLATTLRDPGGRVAGRQGRAALEPPAERRSHRVGGRPRGQPAGPGRRPRHRRRHPDGRLRDGLPHRLPGPGRDVRRDQHQRVRRGQDALRRGRGGCARGAHGDRRGPRRGRPRWHVAGVPPAGQPPSRRSGTSG